MPTFDPEAALEVWAVQADLGDHTVRIPPLPAARWIEATLSGWVAIIPGLVPDLDDQVEAELAEATITHQQVVQAAQAALEEAAGTRWWTALKLVHSAAEFGTLGELALYGVDLGVVSMGTAIQAMYRLFVRNATEQQKAKVDRELDRPPTGVTVDEVYDEDAAADAFERAFAARGGG